MVPSLGVKGPSWKDIVANDDKSWWFQYFEEIERLKMIEFTSCLFPEEDKIIRMELHTFTDALWEACSVSCYTRIVYLDVRIFIRHVKSATRLAPLKTVPLAA